MFVVITPQPE